MNTLPKSKKICSVPNCSSYCDKANKIGLHHFPKNVSLKKQWQLHVTRIGKSLTKNYYVCSKHFVDSDYKNPTTRIFLKQQLCRQKICQPKFSQPSPKLRSLRLQEQPKSSSVILEMNPVNSQSEQSNTVTSYQDTTQVNYAMQVTEADTISMLSDHVVATSECGDCTHMSVADNTKDYADAQTQASIVLDTVIETDIVRNSQLTIDDLIKSSSHLNIMTSLNDTSSIQLIENSIENLELEPIIYDSIFKSQFSVKLKILLVLIKLKQNFDFSVLSVLFGKSIPTIIKYFREMLPVMRAGLKSLIYWPPKEEILMNMPAVFKEFVDVRAILDCTEIEVSQTNCLKCKVVSYSHYKGKNTVKFLIAVSPAGLITYASQGYTGKASDKYIFNKENLIELFRSGDAIIVDKGFAIETELQSKGIKLYRPSFKDSSRQFDKDETIYNTSIAAVRVHVERAIQRIKFFKIMQNRIDHCLFSEVDDILI